MKTPPKRPWYLVAALIAAMALGVGGGCEGYSAIAAYRGPAVDPAEVVSTITDDADRANVLEKLNGYLAVLDQAKPRVFPLAVASLVLGWAVAFFAMRALGGRGSARGLLLQLAAAQGGLAIAAFVLQKDVRASSYAYHLAQLDAASHGVEDGGMYVKLAADSEKIVPPLALGLRCGAALLIVVALTRRRSRDYFDATGDALSGR